LPFVPVELIIDILTVLFKYSFNSSLMISQISNLPNSLNEVLQKIYNILIGSGSTSFLALASAVA
jgi:hypothetical protein